MKLDKKRSCFLPMKSIQLMILMGMISGHAVAQTDQDNDEADKVLEQVPTVETEELDEQKIEQITVTGSRIKRDEFSSSSPVTIINADRSALAGLLDTADILQGSTIAAGQQIDDSFSGFVTDGGPGANSVSLRGLGAQRTLVLVNGKRWGPSGVRGSTNSVDLSALPSSIISRYEILKDGASSVYGADAVAGVINAITKERQDGLQINASSSLPMDGGGENYSLDAIWGKLGDDWSFNIAAEFSQQKELVRSERDYAECNINPRITDQDGDGRIDNRDPITGEELCFGQITGLVTSPFGFARFDESLVPGSDASNPNFDPTINGAFGIPFYTTIPEGPLENQGAYFNNLASNDIAQIVSESDVFSLTSFAEKDISLFNRQSTAYYEFYYNSRETNAVGGYAQLFPVVPAANHYNPFGLNGPLAAFGGFSVRPVILSQGVLDPNNEIKVDRSNSFVGLKGDLTENWTYDTYVGYSRSKGTYKSQRILEDRLFQSLDTAIDGSGNIVCSDQSNGCTAANWFGAPAQLANSFSQEYLDFIRKDIVGTTVYESIQFSANTTGPLFDIWGGSVQGVFGIESRREEIDDTPDIAAQNDNVFSTTVAGITRGSDTVNEAYFEAEFPLAKNAKFAEELTFNVAARYTDYDSFGDDVTERFQLNWQIIPAFKLRATSGTSFRAPDLFEQFLGNQTGFQDGFLDPCINYGQGRNPGDAVYDNCASLGLAPDFGTTGGVPGIETITGGNSTLEAETSDSTTFGIVFTPESLDLSIALNFFEIELENSVASPTVGFVLGDCYGDVGFTSPFCSRIAPRDANGNLTSIDASLLNVGVERTKGVDIDLTYSKSFSSFDLTIDATATKIDEQFTELLGSEFELEGRWGFPEWSGGVDFIANYKDWRFLWGLNYIGSTEEEPVFDPDTTNVDRINRTDSVVYHTLSARYTSTNEWQIIATVRNLLDEQPPIVSDGQNSDSATRVFNTLPGVGYDLLGRTAVLQFSKSF